MLPVWVKAFSFCVIAVIVVLMLIKRIRRRERADIDAPELVLTEDGRLEQVDSKKRDSEGS
ncbi:hypothetical protein [Algicella marina]|uniref:Uncharacterized protein n=1 Tax=Algicella marina TaxID=2683284 RepID=A0A6P1SZX4_9RHOB|nr:hypothetical protein [Algicella marina]QHQ34579.1 hypothetical protein GO499_04925 [Algicella marina]